MLTHSLKAGWQNDKAQGADLLFSPIAFLTDLWQHGGNAFERSQFTLTNKTHPSAT